MIERNMYQFYHMKQTFKEKLYSATKKYVCLRIEWTKTVCNVPYTIIEKYISQTIQGGASEACPWTIVGFQSNSSKNSLR